MSVHLRSQIRQHDRKGVEVAPSFRLHSLATVGASSGDGSQDDFGSEAKKQRLEDDSSDGTVANASLYGSELKSDDAMATDNTVLRDYEGATAFSVNASLAERAIEPALVMFEKIQLILLVIDKATNCLLSTNKHDFRAYYQKTLSR
ncbi:hypothetical protein YC2023_063475 [Brassica napus]